MASLGAGTGVSEPWSWALSSALSSSVSPVNAVITDMCPCVAEYTGDEGVDFDRASLAGS